MSITTHPPLLDISEYFHEFRGKQRPAILFHPRRTDRKLDLLSSKLGEHILWPQNEQWPFCSYHGVPYRPVIQMSKVDFPEMQFWNDTDLFQILWCPHSHEENEWLPARKIYWRFSWEIKEALYPNPEVSVNSPFLETDQGQYIPASCCFYPEHIVEYPDFDELSEELKHRIENWTLPSSPAVEAWLRRENKYIKPFTPGEWLYRSDLSNSTGSKIGGCPSWIQYPEYPICECGRKMELFLSISSIEPGHHHQERWTPLEEQDLLGDEKYQVSFGTNLMFGDGGIVYIFICHCCKEWPTKFVWQCG